ARPRRSQRRRYPCRPAPPSRAANSHVMDVMDEPICPLTHSHPRQPANRGESPRAFLLIIAIAAGRAFAWTELLAQVGAEPLLPRIGCIEARLPFERAEVLRADYTRIAPIRRWIVVGTVIGIVVVVVAGSRPIGLVRDDRPGDNACAQPQSQPWTRPPTPPTAAPLHRADTGGLRVACPGPIRCGRGGLRRRTHDSQCHNTHRQTFPCGHAPLLRSDDASINPSYA